MESFMAFQNINLWVMKYAPTTDCYLIVRCLQLLSFFLLLAACSKQQRLCQTSDECVHTSNSTVISDDS